MFISPRGDVTGSVDWARLEDIARAKDADNVTADGWKAVNALLKEHGRGAAEAEQQAKEAAEAAEKANAEADAGPVASAYVQSEEGSASNSGAGSSGSSAGSSSDSDKTPAKKTAAKRTGAREVK